MSQYLRWLNGQIVDRGALGFIMHGRHKEQKRISLQISLLD
ncbi:MAG: hypothetical protein RIC14_01370 [Filomicrobium sp.]